MALRFSKLGARQSESDIARLMTMAIERPELLSLAAGFTDNATLPLDAVTEAAQELGTEADRTILQYGANQGRADLRAALTNRLAREDGVAEGAYDPRLAMMTNGSQQALYLAVQTLCDEGDIVLVENPTYFVFLEMLRGLGVQAVAMPMAADGDVDLDALEQQLNEFERLGQIERVKAVYLVSYFANPSGHSISARSKQGIVALLEQRNGQVALFEDAAYRELYYTKPHEAASLLSYAAESSVPVFYTTTLTKPFASGLKLGFGYCTDTDWIGRMLAVKGQQDFGTAHYLQALFMRIYEKGQFDRQLEVLRTGYHLKMEGFNAALLKGLEGLGWSWETPQGGLYLWLTAPDGVTTDFDSSFHASCIEEGVMYVPGDLCDPTHKAGRAIRLSFGVLNQRELTEAARRFVAAAQSAAKQTTF